MLDEAMALACGPADDAGTAAKSVCSFFTACYVSGDFERAGIWTDLLTDRGLMSAAARPSGAFLSGHCDSVRAALLVEMGRWGEAEAMLVAAKRPTSRRMIAGAELASRHRARRAAHPPGAATPMPSSC